jgi:hypothetical protein
MAKRKEHTIYWPKEKNIQYTGQKIKNIQYIHPVYIYWPKEKNIQYTGQKKRTYNILAKR